MSVPIRWYLLIYVVLPCEAAVLGGLGIAGAVTALGAGEMLYGTPIF